MDLSQRLNDIRERQYLNQIPPVSHENRLRRLELGHKCQMLANYEHIPEADAEAELCNIYETAMKSRHNLNQRADEIFFKARAITKGSGPNNLQSPMTQFDLEGTEPPELLARSRVALLSDWPGLKLKELDKPDILDVAYSTFHADADRRRAGISFENSVADPTARFRQIAYASPMEFAAMKASERLSEKKMNSSPISAVGVQAIPMELRIGRPNVRSISPLQRKMELDNLLNMFKTAQTENVAAIESPPKRHHNKTEATASHLRRLAADTSPRAPILPIKRSFAPRGWDLRRGLFHPQTVPAMNGQLEEFESALRYDRRLLVRPLTGTPLMKGLAGELQKNFDIVLRQNAFKCRFAARRIQRVWKKFVKSEAGQKRIALSLQRRDFAKWMRVMVHVARFHYKMTVVVDNYRRSKKVRYHNEILKKMAEVDEKFKKRGERRGLNLKRFRLAVQNDPNLEDPTLDLEPLTDEEDDDINLDNTYGVLKEGLTGEDAITARKSLSHKSMKDNRKEKNTSETQSSNEGEVGLSKDAEEKTPDDNSHTRDEDHADADNLSNPHLYSPQADSSSKWKRRRRPKNRYQISREFDANDKDSASASSLQTRRRRRHIERQRLDAAALSAARGSSKNYLLMSPIKSIPYPLRLTSPTRTIKNYWDEDVAVVREYIDVFPKYQTPDSSPDRITCPRLRAQLGLSPVSPSFFSSPLFVSPSSRYSPEILDSLPRIRYGAHYHSPDLLSDPDDYFSQSGDSPLRQVTAGALKNLGATTAEAVSKMKSTLNSFLEGGLEWFGGPIPVSPGDKQIVTRVTNQNIRRIRLKRNEVINQVGAAVKHEQNHLDVASEAISIGKNNVRENVKEKKERWNHFLDG